MARVMALGGLGLLLLGLGQLASNGTGIMAAEHERIWHGLYDSGYLEGRHGATIDGRWASRGKGISNCTNGVVD